MIKDLDDCALLPSLARRELQAWMGEHSALENLQLIASELVTNALVHGRGPWVRMSLFPVDGDGRRYWRLAVVDPGSSGRIPLPRMPGEEESRGRGLWVVDALTCGCWGTERTVIGERVVWALLPR
ncbi:ATP-binding protein [Nonomuraea bangladeshensis]|uniref:ATP-binding protein n=1 Tax=Nonomuraea bangladeshensis TaxID=404385 RepID=A0ABV3H927_9ACTN